jgi:enoyl-CoA hydratase/carnithine racemase
MGFSDDESAAATSGYSAPWLSWIVGEAWAQHMGLCGGQMYARTALRLGLVDQVVPRGMGLSTAMKLAKTFEEKGLTNVRTYKPVLKDARRAIDRRDLDVQGRMS